MILISILQRKLVHGCTRTPPSLPSPTPELLRLGPKLEARATDHTASRLGQAVRNPDSLGLCWQEHMLSHAPF